MGGRLSVIANPSRVKTVPKGATVSLRAERMPLKSKDWQG